MLNVGFVDYIDKNR